MNRIIVFFALILAPCLLTGCQSKNEAAEISDGQLEAERAAVEAEAEPAAKPEYVTLSYRGENARACADSFYYDEDGSLAAVVAGQGDHSESYPVSVSEEDGSVTADIPADNYLHIITRFATGSRNDSDRI